MYATRAKSIKNKPRVNEDPKDALLKQYEDEIQRLKALLEKNASMAGPGAATLGASPSKGVDPAPYGTNQSNIEAALNQAKDNQKSATSLHRNSTKKEETVEQLLAKLQKKGQKVQLVDDSQEKKEKKLEEEKKMKEQEVEAMA